MMRGSTRRKNVRISTVATPRPSPRNRGGWKEGRVLRLYYIAIPISVLSANALFCLAFTVFVPTASWWARHEAWRAVAAALLCVIFLVSTAWVQYGTIHRQLARKRNRHEVRQDLRDRLQRWGMGVLVLGVLLFGAFFLSVPYNAICVIGCINCGLVVLMVTIPGLIIVAWQAQEESMSLHIGHGVDQEHNEAEARQEPCE